MREFILRFNHKRFICSKLGVTQIIIIKNLPTSRVWDVVTLEVESHWGDMVKMGHLSNSLHVLAGVPSGLQPSEDHGHWTAAWGQEPVIPWVLWSGSGQACDSAGSFLIVALPSSWGLALCEILLSCLGHIRVTKSLTPIPFPVSQSYNFRAPLFCHLSLRNTPGSTRVLHLAASSIPICSISCNMQISRLMILMSQSLRWVTLVVWHLFYEISKEKPCCLERH